MLENDGVKVESNLNFAYRPDHGGSKDLRNFRTQRLGASDPNLNFVLLATTRTLQCLTGLLTEAVGLGTRCSVCRIVSSC
jgi:hypothetical protein